MKSPFNRGGLRFCLVILALVAGAIGYSTEKTILFGTPLVLLGVVIHIWAKGCLVRNRTVTMIGPYRYVRHPFYLANGLVDAGIAVMSGWPVLWVVLPIWWLWIYLPVMREEEGFLSSSFPDVYEEYKRRIPRLIPLRRPLPKKGPEFSWRHYHISDGRELTRALRIVAYPLLFFVWLQITRDGRKILTDNYCLELWATSVLFLLYGLAWEAKRHLKDHKPILPKMVSQPGVRLMIALAFLVVAGLVTVLETELDVPMVPVGAAVLVASGVMYLCFRNQPAELLAECLAVLGATIMCELLWLMVIPILLYAALFMDRRLEVERSAEQPLSPQIPLQPAFAFLVYPVVLVCGLTIAVLKEAFID
jgi:protein-S-isoprenylcysteine O-methyltransferase Ste14